ncbi:DUF2798 domain-containing protein [Ensifer sp. ENS07]|jgi:hypothetical protein|uniref:DUF2798 domain-containing protein n=1 Tax=Ensifer adhaerens TaxID=106592 RepID=A0A9Q8Y8N3_ENSAD|nr:MULTISPECIES: DUF2798 domain-containing protein [Ensifer]KSV68101.1 hypothetical protein N182_07660 [Sinorhizobium sp. GL2]KSV73926.1 hypothetical protein N185_19525 [Sinorhizobium sp. GW3]OWZ93288.1 hypothetical protein B9J07_11535 [Sinorhizobium sp. LM21]KQX59753.1 hypothetical protein ASD49_16675 [Ensifer sp. Root1298]KQX93310.1 hypothetical protein ASD41_18355 [Ensifer sp. Root1312]
MEDTLSAPRLARSRKLPPRAAPVAFAFFMSAIMAFLMCCVIVGVNTGIDAGYPARVLGSYALAMPVAFVCVLMVRPVVARLVGVVCRLPG